MFLNLQCALSERRMRMESDARAFLPRPASMPSPSAPESLFPDFEWPADENPRRPLCRSEVVSCPTQIDAAAPPIGLLPSSPAPLPLRRPPFFAAPFLIREAPL